MGAYDVIKRLCEERGIAVTALEKELGFGRGSIGKMKNGKTSAERLQKIADYFGVTSEYLLTGSSTTEPYYLNDNTRDLAQFLFNHPEYKVLFDAARDVPVEDMEMVRKLIERFGGVR